MTGPAPVSISFPLDDGRHHSKQPPLSLPQPRHLTDDDDDDDEVIAVTAQSPRFPRNSEKRAHSHGGGMVPLQLSAVEANNHDAPHCEVYKTHSVGALEKVSPSSLLNAQYSHHHHYNCDERTSETPRTSGWLSYIPTSDGDTHDGGDNRHKSSYVWRVLGYLTCLNPFISILNAVYTFLILLIVAISFPCKNLASSNCSTFAESIISYLSPQLVLHLRFLYPRPHPVPSSGDFGALRLVVVHLFSPIFAVPISAISVCVSFVWLYTEVLLGDKNEETGMEYRSFLFAKQRWESFVLASLKPKELDNNDSFRSV
ncbi:hypothetical protein BDD12DRAFT_72670 [Trichophaea hybrida]|nr:hypothetical protein BDD12DRAFT_72670 [Trichophaea hybrida]